MAYYVVPLRASLTKVVASQLIKETCEAPLSLADYRIYISSQRLGRALIQDLLNMHPQKAVFPPQFFSLTPKTIDRETAGNVDHTLPPLPPLVRQSLLTSLILKWQSTKGESSLLLASRMARSLTTLLDEFLKTGTSLPELKTLVPEEFASHWGINLDFLNILTTHWPRIVREAGYQDAISYQEQNLLTRIENWHHSPPSAPIIAIMPLNPTAHELEFLKLVAGLPNGRVIIFGIDSFLKDEDWDRLPLSHPQSLLGSIFKCLDLLPSSLQVWEEAPL